MSLPTGRQLLLFATLQLVLLWGVALLLARSVTPVRAEDHLGFSPGVQVEWEIWGSTVTAPSDPIHEVSYLQEADFGLSPAFWQRAAGSREQKLHSERPALWRARIYWIPGPIGTIPLPVFEKNTCRPKREAPGARS